MDMLCDSGEQYIILSGVLLFVIYLIPKLYVYIVFKCWCTWLDV